jgi:hypothetical protein
MDFKYIHEAARMTQTLLSPLRPTLDTRPWDHFLISLSGTQGHEYNVNV